MNSSTIHSYLAGLLIPLSLSGHGYCFSPCVAFSSLVARCCPTGTPSLLDFKLQPTLYFGFLTDVLFYHDPISTPCKHLPKGRLLVLHSPGQHGQSLHASFLPSTGVKPFQVATTVTGRDSSRVLEWFASFLINRPTCRQCRARACNGDVTACCAG